jgi:hypothetical protein
MLCFSLRKIFFKPWINATADDGDSIVFLVEVWILIVCSKQSSEVVLFFSFSELLSDCQKFARQLLKRGC